MKKIQRKYFLKGQISGLKKEIQKLKKELETCSKEEKEVHQETLTRANKMLLDRKQTLKELNAKGTLN